MALRACASIVECVPGASVVLVDNLSTIENRQACEHGLSAMNLLNCQFVPMPDNRGYAAGVNAGLSRIFYDNDISLAFAVNSDVEVKEFVTPQYADKDELLVAVTLIESGRKRIGAARFRPELCWRKHLGIADDLKSGCIYVEGCFLGITRSLFTRTQGFSEDYFLYFEELDFVYAYRDMTGAFPKVIHASGIIVEHLLGGSTGMRSDTNRSKLAEYWSSRSRVHFFLKWCPVYFYSAIMYNSLLFGRNILRLQFDLAKAVWAGSWDSLKGWRSKNFR